MQPIRSIWFEVVALVGIVALFSIMLGTYFVPSYQGVDENGYIITARLMATHHGNSGKCVGDPYEFVSGNMVENQEGIYYAKYPIGYPVLCALAYRLGGPSATFLVNPILALLSIIGIFFLGRAVINNLGGAFAALLLATNPLHGYFALSALSHTGAICFTVWGMFFTWRWMQAGGWLNATLAAALTAYGLTVRYTEALLVIPVFAMMLWRCVEIWRKTPPAARRGVFMQTGGQILLMLVATVHKRGYVTACMSNLKQIGAAFQMYWDDNDGKIAGLSGIFPLWTDTGATQAWTRLIYPCLKTTRVFLDPGRPANMPELPIHYYLNLLPAYVESGSPPSGTFLLQSKAISNPSAFILASEDLWINGLQEVDPTNERGDKTGFTGGNNTYPPYHLGYVNLLFADGHVSPANHFDASTMTYWYHTQANWQDTKP